ncbi:phospholipase-like protein [Tanacetum coccineum]
MNSSAHMKLALERCVPKKRKYVDVMRSPFMGLSTTLYVSRMEQLDNQKNVLNPLMIEKWKALKPWIVEFLNRSVVGRCKFPWCNDIVVDRSFWHGLCGHDDNRKGWLLDEVFIPINEPKRNWSLAMFHICSRSVTFYDSEETHDKELRLWYLKMKKCLEKIPMVLKEMGGQILDLRLSRPKCSLEQGLTISESDRDVEKMFEMANFHGTLENHEKKKNDINYMSLEEHIAWEKEEAQSPSYLRSPHVRQRTLVIHGKGKVILDDFEAMGNDLCSKDGLISTMSDGDPAVGGSSLLSVSKNNYCGSSSSNLH